MTRRALSFVAATAIAAAHLLSVVGAVRAQDEPPEPAPPVETEPSDEPSDETAGASDEAEAKIAEFLAKKVISGWSHVRTPHYLVVHDDDVDGRIVNRVTRELEVLRDQALEPMFPPAFPIDAITIVRICESRAQYAAYGAPGGSAGYWSPYHEEVVLHQDKNDKKDAIRVAYAVVCEAYLHRALGGMAAHDWFTLGHGDFFAGHRYQAGELTVRPFAWRTKTALDAKARWKSGIHRSRTSADAGGESTDEPQTADAERERLGLTEWLTWTRSEYDGANDFEWSRDRSGASRGVPGGVNTALGWSLVYFLRTSDDPEHARILPRYWETLTRLARAGGEESAGATTTDVPERSRWLQLAVDAALEGVDVEMLERAWLDHTWVE